MERMTSNAQPGQQGSSRIHTVVIISITLFALSGLMVGFAFRAFTNTPKQSGQSNVAVTGQKPTPTATQAATPSPSPTALQKLDLGCPAITNNTTIGGTVAADNTTDYEMGIQATDRTGYTGNTPCKLDGNGKPVGQAVTMDGLICKIWVSDKTSGDFEGHIKSLQSPNDFSKPFPNEIEQGLIFDDTPQLQMCKQGVGDWKFKLSSSVLKGGSAYYIIGLTYYNNSFNYNWVQITISKQ